MADLDKNQPSTNNHSDSADKIKKTDTKENIPSKEKMQNEGELFDRENSENDDRENLQGQPAFTSFVMVSEQAIVDGAQMKDQSRGEASDDWCVVNSNKVPEECMFQGNDAQLVSEGGHLSSVQNQSLSQYEMPPEADGNPAASSNENNILCDRNFDNVSSKQSAELAKSFSTPPGFSPKSQNREYHSLPPEIPRKNVPTPPGFEKSKNNEGNAIGDKCESKSETKPSSEQSCNDSTAMEAPSEDKDSGASKQVQQSSELVIYVKTKSVDENGLKESSPNANSDKGDGAKSFSLFADENGISAQTDKDILKDCKSDSVPHSNDEAPGNVEKDELSSNQANNQSDKKNALKKLRGASTNDDDDCAEEKRKKKPKETEKYVFFWKTSDIYSQWHESFFIKDDQGFSCAEQYMMYKKAELFEDYAAMRKLLLATNPRKMKELGRKVKNFQEWIWRETCLIYVKEANIEKFRQNGELRKELFNTYPKILVEASPYDEIWGIGLCDWEEDALDEKTWRGRNFLGFILTEVRDELMLEEGIIEAKDKKVYLEQLKEEYCEELREIRKRYEQEESQRDQTSDCQNNSQIETEPTSFTEKENVDAQTRQNENTAIQKTELGLKDISVDHAAKLDEQTKGVGSGSSQITPNTPEISSETTTTGKGQTFEHTPESMTSSSSKGNAEDMKSNCKNKNIDNGSPSSKGNEKNITPKDKPIDNGNMTPAIKDDKETVKLEGETKDTDFATSSCDENKETLKSKGKTEGKNNNAPSSKTPHTMDMNIKTDETKETLV